MIASQSSLGPSFWQQRTPYEAGPALVEDLRADVAIVGAGYTGLWTAHALLDNDPTLTVVVLEADTVGYAASGRNGGFLDTSLTHGLLNGLKHFPDEIGVLERLAEDNFAGMQKFFAEYGVDCDFEPVPMLEVATRQHEVDGLVEWADVNRAHGHQAELLDAGQAQDLLHSPLLLGAVRRPGAGGTLDPAKLVRELARAARQRGVSVYEHSAVTGVAETGSATHGLLVRTGAGSVAARRVVLATNAHTAGLLPSAGHRYVPVYDYVLVSDVLTPQQRQAIGWAGREGVSDSGNRFHYFRLTPDDRILWGGYDAVYRWRGPIGPEYDQDAGTHQVLEHNFAAMFPALADLRFPYRWGGAIATTSRFTVTFGSRYDGRLVYALGYTGLGVGASRFGGQVLADLLQSPDSDLLKLRMVRRPPFPFPPEPLRWGAIALTRHALARADDTGKRGLWLSALDQIGIGFDS
jgi:glycine/D-amino acid oxidase-like deaminating enzyme